jgi:hypothetical protein
VFTRAQRNLWLVRGCRRQGSRGVAVGSDKIVVATRALCRREGRQQRCNSR